MCRYGARPASAHEARCTVGTPDAGFDEALAMIGEHLRKAPGDTAWRELDDDTPARARACRRKRS